MAYVIYAMGSSILLSITDPEMYFRFASLQSEKGQEVARKFHLKSSDFDTVILEEKGEIFLKSTAIFHIVSCLKKWRWLQVFRIFPTALSDFFYDIIARNRYRFFGKSDACRLPSSEVNDRFL